MTQHALPNELETLQEEVRRFCEDREWDRFHGAKDLAIGVITEAGELLEHFRFLSPEEAEDLFAHRDSRSAIESEVADVLIFLLRFAGRYRIDLAAAVRSKLAENAARYPVERSRGNHKKVPRNEQ